jgi:hydroxymethylpyrimidine/phosphomethylpyrimidine kinase
LTFLLCWLEHNAAEESMQQRQDPYSALHSRAPVVLVLAESDPYGASGVQGDCASLAAMGAYAMAVPTSLSVQNRRGVQQMHALNANTTYESIVALLDEPVDAVKIGMLHDVATARAVARALQRYKGPIVVDPMTHRVHRQAYVNNGLRQVLIDEFLPRATVATPNMKAATALCMYAIDNLEMMIAAASSLLCFGSSCLMLKGGGLGGDPVDVVVDADGMSLLWGTRADVSRTRGGGSALSSAVAFGLARGLSARQACIEARIRLDRALSIDHFVGRGMDSLAHRALRLPESMSATQR